MKNQVLYSACATSEQAPMTEEMHFRWLASSESSTIRPSQMQPVVQCPSSPGLPDLIPFFCVATMNLPVKACGPSSSDAGPEHRNYL